MDPDWENTEEGRGGSVSISNVLLISGASGVTIWGGDLSFLAEISKNMEGVHMGFLRRVTGKTTKRQRGGNWISAAAKSVMNEVGMETLGTGSSGGVGGVEANT